MPWMRTVSASSDVSCVGLGDPKRRSQSRDRNCRESRLNLLNIGLLVGPTRFRRGTPRPFCRLVLPLRCGMFLARLHALRGSQLWRVQLAFLSIFLGQTGDRAPRRVGEHSLPALDVHGHLITRSSDGLVARFHLALSGHCVDSSLMYDLKSKAIAKDGPTCFEGERVTRTRRGLCDPCALRATSSTLWF